MAPAVAFMCGAAESAALPSGILGRLQCSIGPALQGWSTGVITTCTRRVVAPGVFCLWLALVQRPGAAHAHPSALGWGCAKAGQGPPLRISTIKDISRMVGGLS